MLQRPMEFAKLNTGDLMPSIGFGTSQSPPNIVGPAVKTAIEIGYRHVDCASIYGNQKEIGFVLQDLIRNGTIKREDIWITSKLWCTDHAPEDVPKALDQTLQDLQLDYLDLYLIHWPVRIKKNTAVGQHQYEKLDIKGTWQAMEDLKVVGKVRNIGVSNFTVKKLQVMLEYTKVVPSVNQVECHPIWQQHKLRSFCASKGIHLSAYAPLGSPGTRFVRLSVLELPLIKELAEKLGRTPAQIALRWGLQIGNSVLPKSTTPERIKSNFDILNWSIPDEDFKCFPLIEQVRLFRAESWVNESGPYKSLDDVWDGEI